MLVNENSVIDGNEAIVLKHNLPGVTIRYTTDGSVPDSNGAEAYKKPITINNYSVIRARATKGGWYSSEVMDFVFFKKGFQPATTELINKGEEFYAGNGASTLIDGKKGDINNLRDLAWLGYRAKPFAAYFSFENPAPQVTSITLSYGKNISAYVMPPYKVEVWGGNDKNKLEQLVTVSPQQPSGLSDPNMISGMNLVFAPADFKFYKVVAIPVPKLPSWHPGKGEKGWVFVDEVFFN